MTWIQTVDPDDDPKVRAAMDAQHTLYPREYAEPVAALNESRPGIVASHSLIPDALHHAFATFGALLAPDLPLERRQHEMIATMVSLTNACHY